MNAIQTELEEVIAPLLAEVRALRSEIEALTSKKKDTMISLSEAAEMLEISQATLRRWIKAGRIKCQRPGGRNIYFNIRDLQNLQKDKAA